MNPTLYARAVAAEIHNDLYEPSQDPELASAMAVFRYREQVREATEFMHDLGVSDLGNAASYRCITVWKEGAYGEVDIEASRIELARIVKLARAAGFYVEKKYDDSTFDIHVKTTTGALLMFYVDRAVMCERRVVGTKTIPAVEAQPEREVEEVVWDCEKISLLALDPDAEVAA